MRFVVWLMIIWFVLTLVACGTTPDDTTTDIPTQNPLITLTVYRPPPIATIPPQFTPFTTRYATDALSTSLKLSPLHCQNQPSNQILCLGTVDNPLDVPVGQVSLTVVLSLDNKITMQQIQLEQATIPAFERAPYRFQFHALYQNATITLMLSEVETFINDEPALTIEQETVLIIDGRYQLTANLASIRSDTSRLIGSLYNEEGQLLVYRIVDLEPSTQSQTVRFDFPIPDDDGMYSHHLYFGSS